MIRKNKMYLMDGFFIFLLYALSNIFSSDNLSKEKSSAAIIHNFHIIRLKVSNLVKITRSAALWRYSRLWVIKYKPSELRASPKCYFVISVFEKSIFFPRVPLSRFKVDFRFFNETKVAGESTKASATLIFGSILLIINKVSITF